jgi:hypothetical protein
MMKKSVFVVLMGTLMGFAPQIQASVEPANGTICTVWGIAHDSDDTVYQYSGKTEMLTYAYIMGEKQPEVTTMGECLKLAKELLGKTFVRSEFGDRWRVSVVEALATFQSPQTRLSASASLKPATITLRSVQKSASSQEGVSAEQLVAGIEQNALEALLEIQATKRVRVESRYQKKNDKIVLRASGFFSHE